MKKSKSIVSFLTAFIMSVMCFYAPTMALAEEIVTIDDAVKAVGEANDMTSPVKKEVFYDDFSGSINDVDYEPLSVAESDEFKIQDGKFTFHKSTTGTNSAGFYYMGKKDKSLGDVIKKFAVIEYELTVPADVDGDPKTYPYFYIYSGDTAQIRTYINAYNGQFVYETSPVVRVNNASIGTHKYTYVIDYENGTYYGFIDGEMKASKNLSGSLKTPSDKFYFYLYGTDSSENDYQLDNVRVYEIIDEDAAAEWELGSMLPIPDEGCLFEETFSYEDINPIYDSTRDTPDPTGLYTKGIFGSEAEGTAKYCATEDMSVTDGKLRILSPSAPADPNWHAFIMPETVTDQLDDAVVVSADVTFDNDTFLTIFKEGEGFVDHNLSIRMSRRQITFNASNTDLKTVVNQTNTGWGEHNVTVLITSDSKFSMWYDGERLANGLPVQKNFDSIADINKISFRTSTNDQAITIDNLQVYKPVNNEFIEVDNAKRGIEALGDIAVMDEFGDIIDFSYDVPDGVSCIFADSDGDNYVNEDGSISFPLQDATTSVTVTIQKGTYADKVKFDNVTIPAMYTFGNIIWPQAIFAQNKNEITYIAKSKKAENQIPVTIVAALYENGADDSLLSISSLTQPLNKDGKAAKGFVFNLDLVNRTSIPENSTVKIFVWDDTSSMTNLVPVASIDYDSNGQRIDN